MTRAPAITGPETGHGHRYPWLRRQVASPNALQMLLRRQPEGNGGRNTPQDINVPVCALAPSQVPFDTCSQTSRSPSATHVDIATHGKDLGSKCAYYKAACVSEVENERVSARFIGKRAGWCCRQLRTIRCHTRLPSHVRISPRAKAKPPATSIAYTA